MQKLMSFIFWEEKLMYYSFLVSVYHITKVNVSYLKMWANQTKPWFLTNMGLDE